jgi:hypothetical protein
MDVSVTFFPIRGHTVVEFHVGQKNLFIARNPRS